MSWIEYQRSILADDVRNKAFERALSAIVRKGESTVVDIGSGTGFLSFLAANLGAKDVVAIEHNEQLLALAQGLAKKNRIRNLSFLGCNSADVFELPPAHLVVSETLGNYALEENILEILRDAKRFLAPHGTLMPRMIEQFVAPVINAGFYHELASWDRVGFGLDYGAARILGFNNVYVRRFKPEDLLAGIANSVCWDRIDLLGNYGSLRKGEASFHIGNSITVNGFASWWRAQLVEDVWLSTSPHEAETHWEQIYFPVAEPLQAEAGDEIRIAITSDSRDGNGCLLKWSVSHWRGGRKLSAQAFDIRKGG